MTESFLKLKIIRMGIIKINTFLILLALVSGLAITGCESESEIEFPHNLTVSIDGREGLCIPTEIDVGPGGGVIISGFFGGYPGTDPSPGTEVWIENSTYASPFVNKYDRQGNHRWSQFALDETTESNWHSIDVDSNGNLYVVGSELNLEFIGPSQINGTDPSLGIARQAILIKYHPAGNAIFRLGWGLRAYGSGDCAGNDVLVDRSGNIYVTGTYYGRADFNPRQGRRFKDPPSRGRNCYLSKLNGSGQLLWTRTWGGISDTDAAVAVEIDLAGKVYVVGYAEEFDSGLITDSGREILQSQDICGPGSWLIQFTKQGNFNWAQVWGGPGEEDKVKPISLAVSEFGQIHVLGCFQGTMELPSLSDGNEFESGSEWDDYLLAFDTMGTKLWVRTWSRDNFIDGWGMTLDSRGNVYCLGNYNGSVDFGTADDEKLISSDNEIHGYLCKFNRQGDFEWVRDWSNPIYAITATPDDLAFITGRCRAPLRTGDDDVINPTQSVGLSEAFIIPVMLEDSEERDD